MTSEWKAGALRMGKGSGQGQMRRYVRCLSSLLDSRRVNQGGIWRYGRNVGASIGLIVYVVYAGVEWSKVVYGVGPGSISPHLRAHWRADQRSAAP